MSKLPPPINPGETFFSKKLNKSVIYIGEHRFVSVGAFREPSIYHESDIGELEPMVRDCHYSASQELNKRFLRALGEAITHEITDQRTNGAYVAGWDACLYFIAERLKP